MACFGASAFSAARLPTTEIAATSEKAALGSRNAAQIFATAGESPLPLATYRPSRAVVSARTVAVSLKAVDAVGPA